MRRRNTWIRNGKYFFMPWIWVVSYWEPVPVLILFVSDPCVSAEGRQLANFKTSHLSFQIVIFLKYRVKRVVYLIHYGYRTSLFIKKNGPEEFFIVTVKYNIISKSLCLLRWEKRKKKKKKRPLGFFFYFIYIYINLILLEAMEIQILHFFELSHLLQY